MKTDETTNDSAPVAAPDELDALAAEVAADAPTPAQADTPPESPPMPTSQLLQPALRLVFDKAAPAWKVSDSEVQSLADVYGALVDKYFPGGVMNRWGLELSALMLTFAVLGPRWGTPTHEAPKEDLKAAA